MARLSHLHERKWINGLLAIASVVVAYVLSAFFLQIGLWMDLEAKMNFYRGGAQAAAVVLGLVFFIAMFRSKQVQQYLSEVYYELTRVVWATKEDTVKLTIGILIGVLITSVVLGFVDFVVNKLLGLLYN
ncbi:MAG: preprotein translocase subunit SecE [Oligoflexia bacterium]|nr:preprotein translocase subunit SecE [Oligoflexia bacterium]MBF0367660.1 preprotein translocase subunit SecE [Oligoflexia bacterium]